jgi:mannose-6-phosphate isomerase-like protein (cupin superfamily)
MDAISLTEKFSLFEDQWTPKIIAQLNGQDVKLAKIQGEFLWHAHDEQDELFHVIRGRMTMEFPDRKVEVGPGEIIVVPKGVEHRPVTEEEVWILLFEPQDIHHTGGVASERTVEHSEHI